MSDDYVADYRRTLDAQLGNAEAMLSKRLGSTSGWPMRTGDVMTLAIALGYVVDLKAIDRAFATGSIKRPRKIGRELLWERREAIDLLMRLERLRSWRPGAGLHTSKMTAFELADADEKMRKMCERFAEGVRERPDFASMTPKQLIAEAVDAETVELRRWAVHCLMQNLQVVAPPTDVIVAEAMRLIADGPDAECRATLGAILLRWVNGLSDESIANEMVAADELAATCEGEA